MAVAENDVDVRKGVAGVTIDSSKFFRRIVPILIGLLLLTRALGMAQVPLMDSTEARYGEIARKMAELNDWVTPWFGYGTPYWGKPPLAFWLTAISFKLFGVSEFAARLPHFLISLVIIALIWWLSGHRDRDVAMPTVAVICAASLYFISSGAVMTDIELTLGTSLAMAGFWFAVEKSDASSGHSRWVASLLFFGGLVVGLLAKGPVSLVFAGTPLFLWTAYNRRWLDVWHCLPWIRGALATLAIALPWYWIAEQRTPGFLAYFLIGEHWHRFVTPGWQGDRYGHTHLFSIGTIWVAAFIDTLPWSLLLPIAAWRWHNRKKKPSNEMISEVLSSRSDDRVWRGYLLIWAITPLLLFTAARNITFVYVLPGMPAAAMLAGNWLVQQRRLGNAVDQVLSVGILITLLITLLLMGRLAFHEGEPFHMERRSAKALVMVYDRAKANPDMAAAALPTEKSKQSNAPLIFVGVRPFSAQFYTRGGAIKVDDIDQCWQRVGADIAYVAIPTWGADAFVASAAAHGAISAEAGESKGIGSKPSHKLSRLYRNGGFDLFYVAPGL
jgi:4-amino-4-deoxy-L-arabinose transferase-like glycosyltransferase